MKKTFALAFFSAPLLAVPAAAAEIKWEVANRFQQFKNEDDFQKLKNAWPLQASAQDFLASQNAASLRILLPVESTWWNAKTGLYDNAGLFNKYHDILISYDGDGKGRTCAWSVNGSPLGSPVPCEHTVRARDLEEKKPFAIAVTTSDGESLLLQSKGIEVALILAVGDSFASGEGNPDHAAVLTTRTDKSSVKTLDWFLKPDMGNFRFIKGAEWWDTACHRSLLSWQSLYAMKKAVMNLGQVVRFASFACSGAEVYDGFFRAQLSPPVTEAQGNRIVMRQERDGGDIMDRPARKNDARQPVVTEERRDKAVLNKSQLNAAIALLCEGTSKPGASESFRPQQSVLRSTYYGKFNYDQCQGRMRQPDEVLVSFGGNDTGFSRVVTWGLLAKTPVKRNFRPLSGKALKLIRRFSVQDPIKAGKMAELHMQTIYEHLAWAFDSQFNINPRIVHALVYPDPLPGKLSESCSSRMSFGNEPLNQQMLYRVKKYKIFNGPAKNFIFRIEDADAKVISARYIRPLRDAQAKAIGSLGWNEVDSQRGFDSPEGSRTICAVAPACEQGKECKLSDRSAWADTSKYNDLSLVPLAAVAQWEAYDATRMRGLRLSNDAVLTQARFNEKEPQYILGDWINGTVHPVAQVHAGIADSISPSRTVPSR